MSSSRPLSSTSPATASGEGLPPRAWWLQFRNQLIGFMREPAAAVFNVLVPIFIVTFQAFAFGSEEIGDELPGYRVVDVLPVTASVMFVLTIGLFAVSIGISSMIESRTLAGARLRVGGVWAIVSTYIAVLILILLAGIIAATGIVILAWDAKWPASPITFGLWSVVASLPLFGTGLITAALGSSARSAQGIASAVFFPLLFLSGAIFPVSTFPPILESIAKILPGYHATELLSASYIADQPFPLWSLVYLLVGAVVTVIVGLQLFRRRDDV